MQVPVYNIGGEVVKNIEISDAVFAVPFNEAVVHQAMVRQRADARQGTSDTKTRGEVAGSRKKLFAQKHTGEARAGDKGHPLADMAAWLLDLIPGIILKRCPRRCASWLCDVFFPPKPAEGGLKVLDQFSF